MEQKKVGFWTYENKMVIILSCIFGFVMLDRQALNFLTPYVLKDLGLSNTQFGFILSGFAFTWAISGYLGAYLSDVLKKKKLLVLGISVFLFSVFSFSTGLALGFASLFAIRLIMGVFEGPVLPIAQSIMVSQSSPARRGFNMGMMQSTAVALLATVIGPIALVAIAGSLGWKTSFYLTIIPGLILVLFIFKTLKEPEIESKSTESAASHEKVSPLVVFKNRNAIISFIMSPFYIGWYILLVSFTPLYLTSVKGLEPATMSYVMAAMGAGGVFWGFMVPLLSDKYGRKPIFTLFSFLSALAPLGLVLLPSSSLWVMSGLCFLGFCGVGCHSLYMSTIPSESVGLKSAATAIGTIMAFGELGGGVVGSAVAGIMADKYGLGAVEWMCVAFAVVAFLLGLMYYETAPSKVNQKKAVAG